MSTARDVTAGRNHPNFNNPAVVGPDTATGNGLADAMSAVLVAKLRCMVIPIRPLIPLLPVSPLLPLLPLRPLRPLFPLLPLVPVQPTLPLFPLTPLRPLFPVQPLIPIQPFLPLPGPIEPPIQPGPPLSAENVRQLEEMIIRSRK